MVGGNFGDHLLKNLPLLLFEVVHQHAEAVHDIADVGFQTAISSKHLEVFYVSKGKESKVLGVGGEEAEEEEEVVS